MSKDQTMIRIRISENAEYLVPYKDYLLISKGKKYLDPPLNYCDTTKILWDNKPKWNRFFRHNWTGNKWEMRIEYEPIWEQERRLAMAKNMGCKWAKDLEYPAPSDDNIS